MIHIRNLKQALDRDLVLKKTHRFNQKAWLRLYIDMNIKSKRATKNYYVKDFFKLMNNSVFEKSTENVRKHRDINLVTTGRRKNYLVSRPSYLAEKFFAENSLAIEVKKIKKTYE